MGELGRRDKRALVIRHDEMCPDRTSKCQEPVKFILQTKSRSMDRANRSSSDPAHMVPSAELSRRPTPHPFIRQLATTNVQLNLWLLRVEEEEEEEQEEEEEEEGWS
ncbi:hypothetical protein EYF80_018422 [Liparis tanakae]|uniref:Uncharacterized protein n=1 Tax=Liparis tanakae TaxID=230148 RepID=A0A4Z2I224_9TELE|nr:hypothetical protein EYF80_018422 [Liparis tanakae]